MKLSEIHIQGFGKWRNQTFQFTPGLNVCIAPNESGKTTLLHALIASLYGMKRDYVRVTRYLDEHERYEPWDKGPYETIIRYVIQNQNFRLHRNFSKDKEQARLFIEPELTDITALYQEDRRKEYNFIEKHLGLSRSLFVDVTWVRSEPMIASERFLPAITANYSEDPVMRTLLGGLETELTAIGKKETAENTLLGKANKQATTAQQALVEAEQAWQSVQTLSQNVAKWNTELESIVRQKQQLLSSLREHEKSLQESQKWWQLSFQTQRAEQLLLWEKNANTIEEQTYHQTVRERMLAIEETEANYFALQNNKLGQESGMVKQPSRFLAFNDISDEEWHTWLKNWYAYSAYEESQTEEIDLSNSNHLDKLQSDYRMGLSLRQQIETSRQAIKQLNSQVKSQAMSAPMNQSNKEQMAQRPIASVSATPMDSPPSRMSRGLGRAANHKKSSGLLWGGSLFTLSGFILGLFIGTGIFSITPLIDTLLLVVAGSFTVVGAGLVIKAFDSAKKVSVPVQSAETQKEATLDPEQIAKQEELEEQIALCESRLTAIAAEWNAKGWEAFLLMRERYVKDIHQSELQQQIKQEKKRLQTNLASTMLRWGVPHHLSFDEGVSLVLKEHQDWEKSREEDQQRLEAELQQQRQRHQVAEQYEQVIEQKTSLILEWETFVRTKLEEEMHTYSSQKKREEDKLQQLEEKIVERKEQIARAYGEIGQRDYVSWAQAKSAYEESREQVDSLLLRRKALELAQESLLEAWKEWHRELSPDLNQATSSIMGHITQGRYQDVRLDPLEHYAIRVIEPNTKNVIAQKQLSSGTQDQLYFAQRIAMITHCSTEKEPLPIFLDDHFIHYDQERLEQTLQYVLKLSEEHQVFLFSCQLREQMILSPFIEKGSRHQILQLT